MTLTPSRIEYDLGTNMHGQPVRLVRQGRRWVLVRQPANQRDDSATIDLSDEQLAMLASLTRGQ
ncbi:hypothetical protein O4H52_01020 [Sphingomonadaceae bacterium G21617-S1]|nr:hypothetical protein [Sphingomonadaceae bacterium G21617-S1]